MITVTCLSLASCSAYNSILKMEMQCCYKTMMDFYQTTWVYNREKLTPHIKHKRSLKVVVQPLVFVAHPYTYILLILRVPQIILRQIKITNVTVFCTDVTAETSHYTQLTSRSCFRVKTINKGNRTCAFTWETQLGSDFYSAFNIHPHSHPFNKHSFNHSCPSSIPFFNFMLPFPIFLQIHLNAGQVFNRRMLNNNTMVASSTLHTGSTQHGQLTVSCLRSLHPRTMPQENYFLFP